MCRSISFRLSLLTFVLYAGPVSWVGGSAVANSRDEPRLFETVHTSNAALFNRLGLSPLRISQGHHKKRLAGPEPPSNFASQNHQAYGRRHSHRDSHVYIVKLPPSLPYYAITRPHKESKKAVKGNKSNGNYPVGFQSNGKPGSIYHWNLPVMEKMAERKRLGEHRLHLMQQQEKKPKPNEVEEHSNEIGKLESSDSRLVNNEAKNELVPSNLVVGTSNDSAARKKLHFRNNDKRLNYAGKEFGGNDKREKGAAKDKKKNYRLEDSLLFKIKPEHNEHRLIWNAFNDPHNSMKQKKHRKKSAMSYYAPFSLKSGSTNLHKNFSGNGKPKAFYVIEKNRKPVYYHPLLP